MGFHCRLRQLGRGPLAKAPQALRKGALIFGVIGLPDFPPHRRERLGQRLGRALAYLEEGVEKTQDDSDTWK
jgi:hypothetical protein